MKTVFWHFINFLILGSILYILLKNKLVEYFKERSEKIRKTFNDLEEMKTDIRDKFMEYEKRLNESEKEIKEIVDSFRKEGEKERVRIINDANREAQLILDRGRFEMEQKLKKARIKLQEESAILAISTAEDIIKRSIKKEDHDRFINNYVKKLRSVN